MKTASLRQVQHNFGDILRWIDDGEEVQITRRREVVAGLVPAGTPKASSVNWAAHERALIDAFPSGPFPESHATAIVFEQRTERG